MQSGAGAPQVSWLAEINHPNIAICSFQSIGTLAVCRNVPLTEGRLRPGEDGFDNLGREDIQSNEARSPGVVDLARRFRLHDRCAWSEAATPSAELEAAKSSAGQRPIGSRLRSEVSLPLP